MKIITLFLISLLLPVAVFIGCEVGSPDSVIQNVSMNVQGVYVNPQDGGKLVANNSGAAIIWMNLLQDGSQIEGIDNNNQVFRGSIHSVINDEASFTLDGSTTAGKSATIDGKILKSGTSATMQGSWIEASGYAWVYGVATVGADPVVTNQYADDDPANPKWQGCCSSHSGIQLDENGKVVFNSSNYVMCVDGTPSPSCHK